MVKVAIVLLQLETNMGSLWFLVGRINIASSVECLVHDALLMYPEPILGKVL